MFLKQRVIYYLKFTVNQSNGVYGVTNILYCRWKHRSNIIKIIYVKNAFYHFNETLKKKSFPNTRRSWKVELVAQCWCKHKVIQV